MYAILCAKHSANRVLNVRTNERTNEATKKYKKERKKKRAHTAQHHVLKDNVEGAKRKPSLWKSKCPHMYIFIYRVSYFISSNGNEYTLHLQKYQIWSIWPLWCCCFLCFFFFLFKSLMFFWLRCDKNWSVSTICKSFFNRFFLIGTTFMLFPVQQIEMSEILLSKSSRIVWLSSKNEVKFIFLLLYCLNHSRTGCSIQSIYERIGIFVSCEI